MTFRNRVDELARLQRWWDLPGGRIGMVWGRRRVGKTALLQRFAQLITEDAPAWQPSAGVVLGYVRHLSDTSWIQRSPRLL